MKPKPVKMWCVYTKLGTPIASSIRSDVHRSTNSLPLGWWHYLSKGYRCLRVTVTPVEGKVNRE